MNQREKEAVMGTAQDLVALANELWNENNFELPFPLCLETVNTAALVESQKVKK